MLRSVNEVTSYNIATDGELGSVHDVYCDDETWVVRYVVVDSGKWLPGRLVLISPVSVSRPDWVSRVLNVSLTRQQVKDSPSIDTDRSVSRRMELQYLRHYGLPPYRGAAVTEGRRNEFRHLSAFADADARGRIPDPQDPTTFLGSRLDWSEANREPHASTLRLDERLLTLRRHEAAIRCERFSAYALTDSTLLRRQDAKEGPSLLAIIQMDGSSEIRLVNHESLAGLGPSLWQLLFTTEDRPFATDLQPPRIESHRGVLDITFTRPSAVPVSWPETPTESGEDSSCTN